jgi:hypothetical protein
MTIRVVLADDQTLVRAGLRVLIADTDVDGLASGPDTSQRRLSTNSAPRWRARAAIRIDHATLALPGGAGRFADDPARCGRKFTPSEWAAQLTACCIPAQSRPGT